MEIILELPKDKEFTKNEIVQLIYKSLSKQDYFTKKSKIDGFVYKDMYLPKGDLEIKININILKPNELKGVSNNEQAKEICCANCVYANDFSCECPTEDCKTYSRFKQIE